MEPGFPVVRISVKIAEESVISKEELYSKAEFTDTLSQQIKLNNYQYNQIKSVLSRRKVSFILLDDTVFVMFSKNDRKYRLTCWH